MQCGHLDCSTDERRIGANLGLYSVTFNNDQTRDLETLQQYKAFREEAERKGFRHFLEVFDPNRPEAIDPDKLPGFINDLIARTLAGVPQAGRPADGSGGREMLPDGGSLAGQSRFVIAAVNVVLP